MMLENELQSCLHHLSYRFVLFFPIESDQEIRELDRPTDETMVKRLGGEVLDIGHYVSAGFQAMRRADVGATCFRASQLGLV